MFYKIILFISVIDLFLAIYFQGNILKSILYLVFSIGLILETNTKSGGNGLMLF